MPGRPPARQGQAQSDSIHDPEAASAKDWTLDLVVKTDTR
jgi:hypothetical protein